VPGQKLLFLSAYPSTWFEVLKIGQLAMKQTMNSYRQRGFSLIEMLVVVSIGFVIAGVGFISMLPMLNRSHIDTAYETTLSVLRNTRHLAITQGHEYIVTINAGTGVMTVQYQPPAPAGSIIYPPVQLVNTYSIPTDTSFAVRSGFPASTPDGFGTGVASVDLGYTPTGGAGGSSTIVFMPDGSARDGSTPSNGGNYSSGVLYMTRLTGVITDSRAISVWGATGRIRGWRLNVMSGVNTWVQL
jgi:prepilin-type N-terminal cleavage/methylation domain-containing protein